MRTLAILGASGHGKVIADAALCSGWTNIIFFDDAWPKVTQFGSWPVIGTTKKLLNECEQFEAAIIGIGDNAIRYAKGAVLREAKISVATIIHPRAVISSSARVGQGSVVFAGAVINPDGVIGEHCIVNTNATVEHDCTLGDAVHISPGANLAGQVCVGELTWVGLGANVRQCITLGRGVKIGAGAVVVKDVPDLCTAIGVPAKNNVIREGNRA